MEALGINLTWFIFQLINFGILFGGLTYLLHKPLVKMIDERRSEVKESLENAERLRIQTAEAEARQAELMREAHTQASNLLSQVQEKAHELETRLTAEAEQKAERLLEKAAKEIEQEHATMKRELKAELADLVIEATGKVLRDEVPLKQKEQGIERIISELS